jgi:hypothetical protein
VGVFLEQFIAITISGFPRVLACFASQKKAKWHTHKKQPGAALELEHPTKRFFCFRTGKLDGG